MRHAESLLDLRAGRDGRDVRHRVVQRRVLPLLAGRRRAVGGDDDLVAGVRAVARGVLDGHVRPRAGDDELVGAEAAEQDVQPGLVEAVHPHLLDDVVAVLGLQALDRRRAPAAAHERVGPETPWNSGAFCFSPGRALLDDVPDVDHRDARGAARGGEVGDVGDDVLRRRVRRARRSRRTRRPR